MSKDQDITERLRETVESCVQSYESWCKDPSKSEARETLQDSVHELRKVASRLEIEIALSERDEIASRPIPIPPHRSKKSSANGGGQPDHVLSAHDDGDQQPHVQKVRKPTRRRKPQPKNGTDGE